MENSIIACQNVFQKKNSPAISRDEFKDQS